MSKEFSTDLENVEDEVKETCAVHVEILRELKEEDHAAYERVIRELRDLVSHKPSGCTVIKPLMASEILHELNEEENQTQNEMLQPLR